jgi:hypothetical protein
MEKLKRKGAMAFRLVSLFYLTALVASALAAFGVWGLLAVVLVPLALWGWHRLRQASEQTKLKAFSLIAVGIIVYVVWPRPYITYGPPPSTESSRRLREFADGLNRLNEKQTLSTDQLSWRVYLLDELPDFATGIPADYRFDEPWDSEHNKQIMSGGEELYQRRSYRGGEATHYLAVVDSRTAWSAERLMAEKEIADGAENTLMLVETTTFSIKWNEPRDLTFDEALALLTSVPSAESRDWHIADEGFLWRECKYRQGAFYNGRVVRFKIPLDRATAVALLTANGGEKIDWAAIDPWGAPSLDYPRIVALGVFVTLALLPIHPAIWRRIMPRLRHRGQLAGWNSFRARRYLTARQLSTLPVPNLCAPL